MVFTWKTGFLLFLILALGAFLRFYNLSGLPPGLYPDEAMNGNNALEVLHGAAPLKVFYPENNGREGLFINAQAYSLQFFIRQIGAIEPWMLRVPSALFGVFTLLGVFLLVKKVLEFSGAKPTRAIPLLATLFMAVSFWHINFSRIGFRAIMAPFFLTWGLYLLFCAVEWLRSRSEHPFSRMLPFAAGFVYGLGFHSYIAYRATPLLVGGILVWLWVRRKTYHRFWNLFVWFLIGSLCALLPLIVFFANNPQDFFGRTAQISVFESASPLLELLKNSALTLGSFFVYGDGNWRHNIAGRPLLSPFVALFFLSGLILFFRSLRRRPKDAAHPEQSGERVLLVLSAGWIAVGALPVIVSNEGIPHALRSILIIPPILMIAAIGCAHLFSLAKNYFKTARSAHILIAFVLTLILFDGYWSYFRVWGTNPETPKAFTYDYIRIARELNTLPNDVPKYVIVDAKGTDVRGFPMPTQTVMFLTDTFLPYYQKMKNIHYLLPEENVAIPSGSFVVHLR